MLIGKRGGRVDVSMRIGSQGSRIFAWVGVWMMGTGMFVCLLR